MTRRSITVPLLAVAIACGKDPGTRTPTAPGVPTFGAVTISGPDNLAPGQTAQFTVSVALSDGLTKIPTTATGIRWTSSSTIRLRIDANGLATGLNVNGDTVVTAEVTTPNGARVRGTREVTVQPAGTYRLIATVVEADTAMPIAGAGVRVLPASTTTGTDGLGQVRLYAVPPNATIRVSGTGYETLEQPVNLDGNSTQVFRLNPSGARVSLSGPYTLTIEAAASCAGRLPAELRQRSYDASITQTGGLFDVRLTEPRFRLNTAGLGNHFTGANRGGTASFTLRPYASWYYYYYYFFIFAYPDLAESLSDGTYLAIDGTATTTQSGGGVTGTLAGAMASYRSNFPSTSSLMADCLASNHKFTLTPR